MKGRSRWLPSCKESNFSLPQSSTGTVQASNVNQAGSHWLQDLLRVVPMGAHWCLVSITATSMWSAVQHYLSTSQSYGRTRVREAVIERGGGWLDLAGVGRAATGEPSKLREILT